ncbi:large conductance mechanosensitive channel protein MscL [Blastococcus goldschmidtiae]|uniref:Large-conductance mechanosensitive channel n=1 Tax=Blastococcus goldschmidtiae TaxID=3075546 RepID=A0ABU2K6H1_9ACTN|nr:large conductance mechanosensitive channel protein MscL [Blastococcus sp. DSM 46792]MDT0275748.1 large conductance mechanosensitive channel protein MscL [Blastococcus sp. DSM 46792]
MAPMIKGFKDFLLRGNVIDLAVAVVIGAAFTALVGSFTTSFLEPLIGLVSGGGVDGGIYKVDEQEFTWGSFVNELITFVLTAAVLYFVVVTPMKRLLERRAAGEEPGPVVPTQVELLEEIRDLLRAQQVGTDRSGPPAGSRREPASGGGQEGP